MSGVTLEAGYAASRGTHLLRGGLMLNATQGLLMQHPEGGQRRFIHLNPLGILRNANFNQMRWRITDGTSDYHSFRISLSKQFRRGLQLQSAYTLSRSTDDTSTWNDAVDFGTSDRRGYFLDKDRGLSAFDIRNSWTTNFVYELSGRNLRGTSDALLGGWSMSGLLRFNGGYPLNPRAGQARASVGRNTYRMLHVEGSTLDLAPTEIRIRSGPRTRITISMRHNSHSRWPTAPKVLEPGTRICRPASSRATWDATS